MKVCIPVKLDLGIESQVFDHFGSAPFFVIYDSETSEVTTVVNDNQQHEHGDCNPLLSLQNVKPDIVVVSGIGGGALNKLHNAGVRVFKAVGETVKENIDVLTSKGLPEFRADHTCSGHKHGHQHNHDESECCKGDHSQKQEGGGCCH